MKKRWLLGQPGSTNDYADHTPWICRLKDKGAFAMLGCFNVRGWWSSQSRATHPNTDSNSSTLLYVHAENLSVASSLN